jgi:hypothetical protein
MRKVINPDNRGAEAAGAGTDTPLSARFLIVTFCRLGRKLRLVFIVGMAYVITDNRYFPHITANTRLIVLLVDK